MCGEVVCECVTFACDYSPLEGHHPKYDEEAKAFGELPIMYEVVKARVKMSNRKTPDEQ